MEKVTLQGTELFALNKAELRSPQPKLDELADVLLKNPSIKGIVVTGHTDRLGTDKLNNALSQRRAEAVKTYLVGKGVAADRIQALGKGSAQAVKTCTDKTRAQLVQCLEPNRRVEVEPVTFERQVR
jgi:OOP family OmpA-OmpF porin